MKGAQVRSLVSELRSHTLHGLTKKRKEQKILLHILKFYLKDNLSFKAKMTIYSGIYNTYK